jgi:hypothetical protein
MVRQAGGASVAHSHRADNPNNAPAASRLALRAGLLALIVALGGSVAARAALAGDSFDREKLRHDGKAIVLIHTSLHEQNCHRITTVLARPDTAGRYVRSEMVTLKELFDLRKVPSQITLAAGTYGVVNLYCHVGNSGRAYGARIVQIGNAANGNATIYDRPIATFKVGAGEVVDIGSLHVATVRTQSLGLFQGVRSEFAAAVVPMPQPWLQNLAAANPGLYKARIVRPMNRR